MKEHVGIRCRDNLAIKIPQPASKQLLIRKLADALKNNFRCWHCQAKPFDLNSARLEVILPFLPGKERKDDLGHLFGQQGFHLGLLQKAKVNETFTKLVLAQVHAQDGLIKLFRRKLSGQAQPFAKPLTDNVATGIDRGAILKVNRFVDGIMVN